MTVTPLKNGSVDCTTKTELLKLFQARLFSRHSSQERTKARLEVRLPVQTQTLLLLLRYPYHAGSGSM